MDVAAWLRGLGLGQYEGAFRESEIEADVLPELTEADLEKLGLPLGPRKRILKAIANLGDEDKSPRPTRLARPSSEDAAERRQLTVMFCDLAGSTALSARLDPEDMRQVIRAYQDACSGVVARYDGFVAKFMGDGILAYFGFPHAHEDDAERAVRAGLEIASVVGALKTRSTDKLQVRIGIATGPRSGRRSRGRRNCTRAGRRRRHAQSRGALARHCFAGTGRAGGGDTTASWATCSTLLTLGARI
jgi:class 3 adenylate cyclase